MSDDYCSKFESPYFCFMRYFFRIIGGYFKNLKVADLTFEISNNPTLQKLIDELLAKLNLFKNNISEVSLNSMQVFLKIFVTEKHSLFKSIQRMAGSSEVKQEWHMKNLQPDFDKEFTPKVSVFADYLEKEHRDRFITEKTQRTEYDDSSSSDSESESRESNENKKQGKIKSIKKQKKELDKITFQRTSRLDND